ncbi:hypothetical protein KGQ64_04395 [bacterium]|nr:hypothetical protein [bacterium]
MKRFGLLNLLLAVLIGLAAWRTVGVWRRPVPEHELPPVDPASRNAPGEGLLAPPPRRPPAGQVITTIAEHDLFDQSRKEGQQVVEAPPPVPTPAPPPPTLKLAGVVLVGSIREALLVDTAQGNKHLRMRIGEDLMGYRVARIESERVALVGPGGEETLIELEVEKGKKAGSAFGPGGKPQPSPRPGATPAPGAQAAAAAGQAGATPATDPATDAKARAESARERLRRLRAEAAQK